MGTLRRSNFAFNSIKYLLRQYATMSCIPILDCVGFLIETPEQVVICRIEIYRIGLSGNSSQVNDHFRNKHRLPPDDHRASTSLL